MLRRAVLCVIAIGCTNEPPAEPPADAGPETVVYLSPTEHLVRASMTLRGTRPSAEELARVAADPEALGAIVDEYVESPAFGSVMKDLHAENLTLRVDNGHFRNLGSLASRTAAEMSTAYEEPLRLIEYVVMNDRPYSEIVTADYAMSDPITSVVFGMSHSGGTGVEVGQWQDERPVAGILSSSGLWSRHTSNGPNYHRGRANVISSVLLCFDFLHSDIILDTSIDLANPDEVANALVDNASCAACHQALDPLASTLYGFQFQARYATYPMPSWKQEWVGDWVEDSERPPSYFGKPAVTVADVGEHIAADPRFPRCAAERFAAYFTQTEREHIPFAWGARLAEQFVANDMSAKRLARDIVMSDEFRVSHASDAASAGEADALRGMLRTRPEQLDTMFADLTGFRWHTSSTMTMNGMVYGVANLLRSDYLGFRALGGGIDSYFVTEPTHTTNAVSSLLLRELAREAAGHVVENDWQRPPSDRVLLMVEESDRDPAAIRAEISRLHARIFGTIDAADGTEVAETYALFSAVLAETNSTRHAWRTTLTAMLSDLRVAYY